MRNAFISFVIYINIFVCDILSITINAFSYATYECTVRSKLGNVYCKFVIFTREIQLWFLQSDKNIGTFKEQIRKLRNFYEQEKPLETVHSWVVILYHHRLSYRMRNNHCMQFKHRHGWKEFTIPLESTILFFACIEILCDNWCLLIWYYALLPKRSYFTKNVCMNIWNILNHFIITIV